MQSVDSYEEIARRLLKPSKAAIEGAYKNVRACQNREFEPAKTGFKYLDDALLGGLRPQKVISIGARSGCGKSYFAQRVCENIMDMEKNPQAMDYFLVNCEFEMTVEDLLVRKLTRDMGKPVRSILTERQTAEEEAKMEKIVQGEKSNRVFYLDEPTTTQELRAVIEAMCKWNMGKKLILFKIDHLGLIKRNGMDPKRVMDETIAMINEMKLKYKNSAYIVISQFNRNIEERRSPKEHEPRMSDFYMSDELAQLSSVMIGLNNPRRMGYDKYMLFPANWYPSLDRFKTPSKTSFQTEGLLFHHVLKVRDTRIEELPETIYPEILPGYGYRYGEGGVRFINKERPEPIEKPFKITDNPSEIEPPPIYTGSDIDLFEDD